MDRLKDQWWQSPLFRVDAAGVSVLLLASGLAYALAVYPYVQRSERAEALRLELEQARDSMEKARESQKAADLRLAELLGKKSAAPLVLEPVSRLNDRMTRLAELARSPAAGLKLQETAASAPNADVRCTTVPLKLTGSGTYVGVSAFLAQLHQEFRDLRVMSLKVSGNPGKDDVTAVFSVELVWYAAPEVRADIDSGKDRAGVSAEK
ncbi:MAG: hypothetical protein ACREJO_02320 [Phycisphaerales bacterium]